MDSILASKLLTKQQSILSNIALGKPFTQVANEICFSLENLLTDKSARCALLIVKNGQLFHCAAPTINSATYSNLFDGHVIADSNSACSLAAHLKKRYIVENIRESELDFYNQKDFKSALNINACCSTPILSSQTEVLGVLTVYFGAAKKPSDQEIALIDNFVHSFSIALERYDNEMKFERLIKQTTQSNEKFKAFTDVMPDLALILCQDGIITDLYGSDMHPLHHTLFANLGGHIHNLLPDDAERLMSVINQAIRTQNTQFAEYEFVDNQDRHFTLEGRFAPLEHYQSNCDDKISHVLLMLQDITEKKKSEQEIKHLAYYDVLTKLPNRRLFYKRMDAAIKSIATTKEIGALLFLDIDNFKRINDSLGHNAGDQLLVEVANRLQSAVRRSDMLARAGGDEFVILIETLGTDIKQANLKAETIAKNIQNIFLDKFQVGTSYFQVSGSIGICLIEGDHLTTDNILKFADTAMYLSKSNGGNSFSHYDPKVQTQLDKQVQIESDIIRAIEAGEFCAYFQPQVDADGKILGGEALIRWNHPTKGLISPMDFIPIAEQFGLIQSLQNIVLHDICRLLTLLGEYELIDDTYNLSINISSSQFKATSLKFELLNIIKTYPVKPQQIILEITESMLTHDVPQAVAQMEELEAYGFSFSIDDFGTGYSCLRYLQEYPVKELKIDKSFVDKIFDEKSGLSIVNTVINLAKNLNMKVVAEGVETQEQFNLLKQRDVDIFQGYLLSKPMMLSDYIQWHIEHHIDTERKSIN